MWGLLTPILFTLPIGYIAYADGRLADSPEQRGTRLIFLAVVGGLGMALFTFGLAIHAS